MPQLQFVGQLNGRLRDASWRANELIERLLTDYKRHENLIGENGLLKLLTKKLLERTLQAEMAKHLGQPCGQHAQRQEQENPQFDDKILSLYPRGMTVRRDGDALVGSVGSDYGGVNKERRVDQVVANHGTLPLDELYFELKPQSVNEGAVNYTALLVGQPQSGSSTSAGRLQLFRIGDAVSARNTHAAIFDALRLCVTI